MSFSIRRISTSLPELVKNPASGPDLDTVYDAIVVGSGYGGAISAAKLALAGRKVLLLERGREILPGAYPRSLTEAQAETQITTAKDGRLTDTNGMLDLRVNDDMSVVVGCGLGGTSLINANVSLEPVEGVFQQTETGKDGKRRYVWPKVFRENDDGTPKHDALASEYEEARTALGANQLPETCTLPKLESLKKTADDLGYPFERPPINVTFADGKNHFGNHQVECTMCGDCCSGCNYGAKNTTLMNYLPFAEANGAAIVTEALVHTVAQDGALWSVRISEFGQAAKDGRDVKAHLVVLAAGTLGSTEILKRSEVAGLKVASDNLGKGFSGNGDVLGFGFDANWKTSSDTEAAPIYSIGAGTNAPDTPAYKPGPCIAGTIRIDMEPGDEVRKGVLIEEGVAPGPLSMIYPAIFFLQDAVNSDFLRFPDSTRRLTDIQALGDDLLQMKELNELSYTGAVANTQSYLLMSHDDASGQLVYDDKTDCIRVEWPGVGHRFPFPRDNEILRKASDTIWANYIANPIWSEPYGWKVVTTHPVGGCRMADSAEHGVVNADCQVFTGDGDSVHEGLMVCDGAVIPSALGVNPLLTISAVTIRAMDVLIKRKNWTVTDTPKNADSTSDTPPLVPIEIDPFADAAKAVMSLQTRLSQAYLGIQVGRGNEVKKTMADAARAYVKQQLSGLALKFALSRIDAAEKAADMSQDIGPALNTLINDLGTLHSALAPNPPKPETEVAQDVVRVLRDVIGDISSAVSFTETMHGAVSAIPDRPHPVSDAYEIGLAAGKADGLTVDALFHVSTPDVAHMMNCDVSHTAELAGTLTISGDGETLPVGDFDLSNGKFELLKLDGTQVDRWLMTYRGDFNGLTFTGYKTLQRRPGSDWWTDLTTLNVDILGTAPSKTEKPPVLARGQMTLGIQDFIKQAQTIHADYASDPNAAATLFLTVTNAIQNHSFQTTVKDQDFLSQAFKYALATYGKDENGNDYPAVEGLAALADAEAPMLFANLIFQSYGGLPSYLYNYPARDVPEDAMPKAEDGATVSGFPDIKAQCFTKALTWTVGKNSYKGKIQLTRFEGGKKGPVILANGLGFRGMAFALNNAKLESFVQRLLKNDYDVWLFDHRASPQNVGKDGKVNVEYTVDQIAEVDWPWAIDEVLKARSDVGSVQVMAHCLGGLTAMMSVAGGHAKGIRQMIISQFSLHPVTGWFNQMKADTNLAALIHDGLSWQMRAAISGLSGNPLLGELFEPREIFDLRSFPPAGQPDDQQKLDLMIDTLVWNAPFPSGEPCYSPTCHRVFGVFGPVYLHAQLDQFTHNAIGAMAGPVATRPFLQLGGMMKAGVAVDAEGRASTYMDHADRFDFPVHLFSGSLNQLVTTDTTLRTLRWLEAGNDKKKTAFDRHVFDGFGHLDCFIGRDAPGKVFEPLVDILDKGN